MSSKSTPRKWQNAVHLMKDAAILPKGSGFSTRQVYAAWCGDKFLGASAAKILFLESREKKVKHTRGSATMLMSIALSNSFMASNIDTILPNLYKNVRHLGDHCIGTIVEAAVAELSLDNSDAVDDLARWLILKAEDTPDPNAKGHLLSIGGKVYAERTGGSDHAPSFYATAEHRGYSENGVAGSKKKAEQIAAAKLLKCLAVQDSEGLYPGAI